MPRVGFFANKGNRLDLDGCKIKKVELIPEQELVSVENTTTFFEPDGITIQGIQQSYTKSVTIKLKPNINGGDSDTV